MKIYILEDEVNIQHYLFSLVDKIPYLQLVGFSAEIEKAAREIPIIQPDLVLADIQLKDGNSFTLFEKIALDFHLIFITAYNQYAIQALNLGAFGYILKPVDERIFFETIEKCYKKQETFRFKEQQIQIAERIFKQDKSIQKIALKNSDATYIVAFDEIVYCSSDKGYTTFILKDGSNILVSKVLKEYEVLLPNEKFIRCHQSYLVNSSCIKTYYKDGFLEMNNKHKIPVSDRRKSQIIQFFENIQ
jgi:two-component system LytT family response regulator